jgi:hypothetical protein
MDRRKDMFGGAKTFTSAVFDILEALGQENKFGVVCTVVMIINRLVEFLQKKRS